MVTRMPPPPENANVSSDLGSGPRPGFPATFSRPPAAVNHESGKTADSFLAGGVADPAFDGRPAGPGAVPGVRRGAIADLDARAAP
jgi:hypothetical protein